MIKEISAGCFVLNNKNEVLLIERVWPSGEQSLAGPKGHKDDGEDIETTAVRETTEETGYTDIEIIRELKPETYNPKDGYIKTVRWFEARLKSDNNLGMQLEEEELKSKFTVLWINIKDAIEKTTYPVQKENLKIILDGLEL